MSWCALAISTPLLSVLRAFTDGALLPEETNCSLLRCSPVDET